MSVSIVLGFFDIEIPNGLHLEALDSEFSRTSARAVQGYRSPDITCDMYELT